MEERVIPAAKKINADWLDVPPKEWDWDKNVKFLDENISRVESGKGRIFDIGGERGRYQGPNAIYTREKEYMMNNGFQRTFTGKWITAENGKKFRLYEWIKNP